MLTMYVLKTYQLIGSYWLIFQKNLPNEKSIEGSESDKIIRYKYAMDWFSGAAFECVVPLTLQRLLFELNSDLDW